MRACSSRSWCALLLGGAGAVGVILGGSLPVAAQTPSGPTRGHPHQTRSDGVPAPDSHSKLPAADQVLLQQRRAEVQGLEAAWAAKRREVEKHLADVRSYPRFETDKAESAYQQKRVEREIAEIAVKEYEDSIYLLEKTTAQGAIKLAESDLARAKDRLDEMTRKFERGQVSVEQKLAAELTQQRAKLVLEQAQSDLFVLENYTKQKVLEELKSKVSATRLEEQLRQKSWELAQKLEQELVEQAAKRKSPLTEAHIAALLTEAASLQAEVVQLLSRVEPARSPGALTAEEARRHAIEVQKVLEQARSKEDIAQKRLGEALKLSRLVQGWREELRDAAARLRQAREGLERLEKMMQKH